MSKLVRLDTTYYVDANNIDSVFINMRGNIIITFKNDTNPYTIYSQDEESIRQFEVNRLIDDINAGRN